MSIKQKIVCLLILVPYAAFAKSGSVNYSWGADCAGHDARLRGHDDAVCPVYMLLHRIRSGHRVRLPDLHQDEHWRGRHRQILFIAAWRVPVHHRGLHRASGIFRLSHIRLFNNPIHKY